MVSTPARRRRRTVDTDQYLAMTARILSAAGQRVGEADEEQLTQLLHLQALLDDAIARAVSGLRASGCTWEQIGVATGTTRQGAQQRWGARLAS